MAMRIFSQPEKHRSNPFGLVGTRLSSRISPLAVSRAHSWLWRSLRSMPTVTVGWDDMAGPPSAGLRFGHTILLGDLTEDQCRAFSSHLMHNWLDQEVREMTQRPTEPAVQPLSAGVRRDLGSQTS